MSSINSKVRRMFIPKNVLVKLPISIGTITIGFSENLSSSLGRISIHYKNFE
jgi:hypothetical protein